MKKNKEQKKGQETTIGKIIYGFLLFMPLLAISTTILITTFNMSAKEEAEITYKYKSNEVTSETDLIKGNIYNLDFSILYPSDIGEGIVTLKIVNGSLQFNLGPTYIDETTPPVILQKDYEISILLQHDTFAFYIGPNGYDHYIAVFSEDSYNILTNNLVVQYIDSQFNSISSDAAISEIFSYTTYNEIESVETHNLDTQEVFYNAVNKVTESPLFNWAQNSIIYTTTNATCNTLSITTPFIPLLMSYWLIISVIYFLYDIALMLVWLIHRKIHELQESL